MEFYTDLTPRDLWEKIKELDERLTALEQGGASQIVPAIQTDVARIESTLQELEKPAKKG